MVIAERRYRGKEKIRISVETVRDPRRTVSDGNECTLREYDGYIGRLAQRRQVTYNEPRHHSPHDEARGAFTHSCLLRAPPSVFLAERLDVMVDGKHLSWSVRHKVEKDELGGLKAYASRVWRCIDYMRVSVPLNALLTSEMRSTHVWTETTTSPYSHNVNSIHCVPGRLILTSITVRIYSSVRV